MVFSQFLVLPVVPFITKFNRYIVLGLLVVGKFGNNFKAIPDGFSKEKGNYIYKDRNGISQLELDWNKDYHVGFEWLPDIDDEGGTRLIYGSLTANKSDFYVLATPNSKSLKIQLSLSIAQRI